MKLIIPIQNPTRFYKYGLSSPTKFQGRLLKDYKYTHTVFDWQQEVKWAQPWQSSDVIRFQVMCDNPIKIKVINTEGVEVINEFFIKKPTNWVLEDMETYELSFSLQPGFYYFCIIHNETIIAISECQEVVTTLPNSLLIQYKHRKNFEDMAFDTGIELALRIPGIMTDFKFGSEDVMYLDQQRNQTVLDTKSWGIYTLILGNQLGVPDYFAEIVNKAISLSNVKIDGSYYSKNEAGAKLERTGDTLYSRAGWRIDLTESDYRTSYEIEKLYLNWLQYNTNNNILINDLKINT